MRAPERTGRKGDGVRRVRVVGLSGRGSLPCRRLRIPKAVRRRTGECKSGPDEAGADRRKRIGLVPRPPSKAPLYLVRLQIGVRFTRGPGFKVADRPRSTLRRPPAARVASVEGRPDASGNIRSDTRFVPCVGLESVRPGPPRYGHGRPLASDPHELRPSGSGRRTAPACVRECGPSSVCSGPL
jgi:hypothetical protein